jgi:hypothetical protein
MRYTIKKIGITEILRKLQRALIEFFDLIYKKEGKF